MDQVKFKGKNIRYYVQGEGEVLVLIHGYLEALDIWNGFAGELAKNFRVIRLDLPGHGKSDIVDPVHQMELLADAVKEVLDTEKVAKCSMVGHSLGGYVTLAFLEKYPEKLRRVSLFHSHPFADSEQVKANRQKEIEMVKNGEVENIIDTNIPKAFADKNLQKLEKGVEWAKEIAYRTEGKGIISNLRGMMERPDRSELVKGMTKPFLLIAGKNDNYIDYNQVIPKIELPEKGCLVTLEKSGHLGFVEERKQSLEVIYDFMKEN